MRGIILACLLLGGCATTWYHDTAGEQEFWQNETECQQVALGYGGVSGYGTAYRGVAVGGISRTANRHLYNACMRSKGWSTER